MNDTDKKQQRGQFFTVDNRVQQVMSALLKNTDNHAPLKALEPSAGSGDLVKTLEEKEDQCYLIDAVELDETLDKKCNRDITIQDFFLFSENRDKEYDVIIGNPPYVAWKKTEAETQASAYAVKERYSDKTNLYHLFIDRCIDLLKYSGEMVLIIPKEWLYTTSAAPLRTKIAEQGTITDYVDCGEEKLFPDADVPALVIIRFVKGADISFTLNSADSVQQALDGGWENKKIISAGSRWMLVDTKTAADTDDYIKLSEVFGVKVGFVSGADNLFRAEAGKVKEYGLEAETIKPYITTKGIEDFIDVNEYTDFESIPENTRNYLLRHKEDLLKRGIRKFDESNWWHYGAVRNKQTMITNANWISVEARTRRPAPFKLRSEPHLYSGGILGLYPTTSISLQALQAYVDFFNSQQFKEILKGLFIMSGNKISMQPATLQDALIPDYRSPGEKQISPAMPTKKQKTCSLDIASRTW